MAGPRLATAVLAGLAALVVVAPAAAHPLGNFSVNHQTRVQISRDRVDLLYILDQAEIPTFRERTLSRSEVIDRKLAEVRRKLFLVIDGRRTALALRAPPKLELLPGQGGLKITRVEMRFRRKAGAIGAVEVRDLTFNDRVGWADMVSVPGSGTAVSTYVSPNDPTNGLRTYRGITLKDVPDQVVGRFSVRPGRGSLTDLGTGVTYGAGGERPPAGAAAPAARSGKDAGRSSDEGFASVFDRAAQGEGVFLVLLLAAFAWGALHAISPGHGKAMVAAYLVGTRGTARHAVALGGIVTVTHTIGVFALGLVTLLLSQYILPEDLYPWLNLAAGLLIVAVGAGVLRSRLRWGQERRARPAGPDQHAHDHGHVHGPDEHFHEHGHEHGHEHHHHHVPDTSWKGLAGMGISAGLIPCPSALVVLLAAITQEEVGLGLLLITVFSLGLAMTLTALGLAVVYAKRLAGTVGERLSFGGRLISLLPAASTLAILALGLVLTAKALPDVL